MFQTALTQLDTSQKGTQLMDAVEIFGTALLAIAAAGSAIAISVGLTITIRRFVSKIFFKKQAMRKKSESATRIKL